MPRNKTLTNKDILLCAKRYTQQSCTLRMIFQNNYFESVTYSRCLGLNACQHLSLDRFLQHYLFKNMEKIAIVLGTKKSQSFIDTSLANYLFARLMESHYLYCDFIHNYFNMTIMSLAYTTSQRGTNAVLHRTYLNSYNGLHTVLKCKWTKRQCGQNEIWHRSSKMRTKTINDMCKFPRLS